MSNVIRLVRVGTGVRRQDEEACAVVPASGSGAVVLGGTRPAVAGRGALPVVGDGRGTAGVRPRIRAVPGGIAPYVGVRAGMDAAHAGTGPGRGLRAGARPGAWDACVRAVQPTGLTPGEAPDAAWVVARLEEAGRTLLALPGTGYSTRLRTSNLDIVRTAMEAYGGGTARVRPPVPSAAHITRMDEALGWIPMIPQDRYVLRRIVGARCLINPVTDRPLYSWRKLATLLGADHKAVQRWHANGITILVSLLSG